MNASKENNRPEGARQPEPKPQPSTLTLDECLKLISMNKDSPFELDTFVHVPLEPREPEKDGVHGWANRLRDMLAKASEYQWK